MSKDSLWTGLRLSHVRLIATFWVRFSLRTGGGLITLMLVLLVGLGVASIWISPFEQMMEEAPSLGHAPEEAAETIRRISESDQFSSLVQSVTGADEAQASYLLREQPSLLSVIFIVLMWIYPFIACLGAFNQTAGDIGSRGLRYLLIRTERPNILAGRFVGTVAAAKSAAAIMFVVLLIYVLVKISVWPVGEILLWGLQGYIAIVMLMIPYIALCAWVSTWMDSPFAALSLSLAMTGASIIALKLTDSAISAVDLGWLERLMPWGWKFDLLSGDVATRLTAYAVMLGFTALFFVLALITFHKRDL